MCATPLTAHMVLEGFFVGARSHGYMAAGWWVAHGDGFVVTLFTFTWQYGALEGPRCPSKWACLPWFLIHLRRRLIDLLFPQKKSIKKEEKKGFYDLFIKKKHST